MKKITMSVVVALFVLLTFGLTGCMSNSDPGLVHWDRPDAGDMTGLGIDWNH